MPIPLGAGVDGISLAPNSRHRAEFYNGEEFAYPRGALNQLSRDKVKRETGARQIDSLLLRLLFSSVESEAEEVIDNLLAEHAAPIIAAVVGSTLSQSEAPGWDSSSREWQDLEDIISDVNTNILFKLRRLRESADEHPIEDFGGYVATAARNACHNYLRAKYPNRARHKNKLRYVLTRHPDFALWEGEDGKWICGFAHWHKGKRAADCSWIHRPESDPSRFIYHRHASDPIELIRAVFDSSAAPILMEDLVTITARVLKVEDHPPGDDRKIARIYRHPRAADPIDPADAADQKEYLKRLWSEIEQLPRMSQIALLFGARDDQHSSIPVLLAEIGIISIRQVAAAVDVPPSEFAGILIGLPFDDRKIAEFLGVSRQQVVSYRLSARRRLERRMNLARHPRATG